MNTPVTVSNNLILTKVGRYIVELLTKEIYSKRRKTISENKLKSNGRVERRRLNEKT